MLHKVLRRNFATIVEHCTLQRLGGQYEGVALIEIDNPESRNALSSLLIENLNEIIEETKNDNSIRCAILRSSTPGIFCAGADLKARLQLTNNETEELVAGLRKTFHDFYNLPFPTIASIDGAALGGGLEIALSCDMRIASQNSLLGLPETALAIIPGAGGTQKLARIIGVAKAKELIYTAQRLTAAEAKELGILNYVADDYEGAYEKSLELAKKILRVGPIGVRAAKNAINEGIQYDLNTGLEIERINYSKVAQSNDRIEGLKAFVEKRRPNYQGN